MLNSRIGLWIVNILQNRGKEVFICRIKILVSSSRVPTRLCSVTWHFETARRHGDNWFLLQSLYSKGRALRSYIFLQPKIITRVRNTPSRIWIRGNGATQFFPISEYTKEDLFSNCIIVPFFSTSQIGLRIKYVCPECSNIRCNLENVEHYFDHGVLLY